MTLLMKERGFGLLGEISHTQQERVLVPRGLALPDAIPMPLNGSLPWWHFFEAETASRMIELEHRSLAAPSDPTSGMGAPTSPSTDEHHLAIESLAHGSERQAPTNESAQCRSTPGRSKTATTPNGVACDVT